MRGAKVKEPAGLLVFIAICAFISLLLYAAVAGTRENEEIMSRRASYVAQECTLVGFYGRNGERKVYNCRGRILREEDIP